MITNDSATKKDTLGREKFAKQIVTSLTTSFEDTDDSIVVGICGSWGSGKSTLLNFINNEIGIQGVKVNAYDATNTVIATTFSAANGTYSLPFTVSVRVEFEMQAATSCVDSSVDFSSISVARSNTTPKTE